MSDNILSAVMTFGLLLSGTAAIGADLGKTHRTAQATTQVVTLPAVTITGHRVPPSADATRIVMLPAVTITGRRDTVLAQADTASVAHVR